MKIEKKCLPEYFNAVLSGEKNFELRLADWECGPGDSLVLREWEPKTQNYTGREVEKKITYVLKTKNIHLWPEEDVEKFGYQILGLQ